MAVQSISEVKNQTDLLFLDNSKTFQNYVDYYKNLYGINLTIDEIKFCVEESITLALFDIWHNRYKSLLSPVFIWNGDELTVYVYIKDEVKPFDLSLLDDSRIQQIKAILLNKLQRIVEKKMIFQNGITTLYNIVTGSISKISANGSILVDLDTSMQTRTLKLYPLFPLVYQPLTERKFYKEGLKLHFYLQKLIFSDNNVYIILARINKKFIENLLKILTIKEQDFFLKRWRVKPVIKCIYRDAGRNSVIGTNFFIPKDKLQMLSNLLFSEVIRVKSITKTY